MKTNWSHLDKWRNQEPPYASPPGVSYGSFLIRQNGYLLIVIATDGHDGLIDTGWEHVSVHAYDPVFKKNKTPNWEEMCFAKGLFWDADECVVQFHPAEKDYISIDDNVLHLWRYKQGDFPMPPKICV